MAFPLQKKDRAYDARGRRPGEPPRPGGRAIPAAGRGGGGAGGGGGADRVAHRGLPRGPPAGLQLKCKLYYTTTRVGM